MIGRRTFLKSTGLMAAAAAGGASALAGAVRGAEAAGEAGGDTFRLGMAGYTFNKFALEPSLEMLKTLDMHLLCIKDFHLPLKATEAEIAAFHAKCKQAGVTGYGVGPIYMGSEEEISAAFAYAKRVGVKLLVGVPFVMVNGKRTASAEMIKVTEAKVKEYDILCAIHNHGPDMPELYPNAENIMEYIQGMDKRLGLCLDIGHEYRDGKDPIKAAVTYADRLHDVHLKNVTANTRQGAAIELPRGKIDIPAFVGALRKIQYKGVCGLEHEKDMGSPLTGVAESVGYFRGVMDAGRAKG